MSALKVVVILMVAVSGCGGGGQDIVQPNGAGARVNGRIIVSELLGGRREDRLRPRFTRSATIHVGDRRCHRNRVRDHHWRPVGGLAAG